MTLTWNKDMQAYLFIGQLCYGILAPKKVAASPKPSIREGWIKKIKAHV